MMRRQRPMTVVASERIVMRRVGLVGLVAVVVCGCGGGGSAVSTGTTTALSAASSALPRVAEAASGTGVIAGIPFTAASAFAQYDSLQKVWWIVVGEAGHACSDVNSVTSQIVSAVRPNVDASFPAGTPGTLPKPGPKATGGVTFQDTTGYPSTVSGSGVSITLDHADATVGRHWTGRIHVTNQSFSGNAYAFTGEFTATVCPPVAG